MEYNTQTPQFLQVAEPTVTTLLKVETATVPPGSRNGTLFGDHLMVVEIG